MALNYNVAKCKNPNGAEGVDYFSCKARKTSDYTFKELAQDINNSTTVTKADAMAVLASMKPFIESALLSGRRVVLDDLGSLVISVRSKCFTKADMQESQDQGLWHHLPSRSGPQEGHRQEHAISDRGERGV